mgnify:CR=1 FL=1
MISMISINNQGIQSDASSGRSRINATGRLIVFQSASQVWGQPGNYYKVFLYDSETAPLELISVSSEGVVGNKYSGDSDISDDGRYIVFNSEADNLVADDSNESIDVFLHDRKTGTTERIGLEVWYPRISGDGRYVVFQAASPIQAVDPLPFPASP